METVTNAASTVATTASKIIFGDPATQQAQSGTEPVSGQTGTKDQPYDAGNADGLQSGSSWSHEHALFGFGVGGGHAPSQPLATNKLTEPSEPVNVGQSGVTPDTTGPSASTSKIADTTGIAPLSSGGDPTSMSTNTRTAEVIDSTNVEPLTNTGASTTAASATSTGSAHHGGHADGTPTIIPSDKIDDVKPTTETAATQGPIEKLSSDHHQGTHHGAPLQVLGQIDGNDKVKTAGNPEDGVADDGSKWDDRKKDTTTENKTSDAQASTSPSPSPGGKEKGSLKDKLKEKLHIGKKKESS